MPWGPEQDRALTELKKALTSPPVIALPNCKVPFQIHTDASEWGACAALTQVIAGSERVT